MAKKSKSAERSSRSAAPSGPKPQSSPVLVIFLVLFVLVSVVMGVLLYMDKDKLTQAKNDVDKANAEKKVATDAYALEMGYLRAKLKSYFDPATTNEDEAKIKDFEGRTTPVAGSILSEWLPALRKKIEGNPDPNAVAVVEKEGMIGPYDPRTGKLANNFESKIRKLEDHLRDTKQDLLATSQKLDSVSSELKDYRAKYNDTSERAAMKKVRDEAENERKKLDAQHQATRDKFEKDLKTVSEQLAIGLDEAAKERDKATEDAKNAIEAVKLENERKYKEERRKWFGLEIIHFDTPRGQITRVEQGGKLVTINIGSEQRVRPQLTFSVYGKGPGGKAEPIPKAHIELISVTSKSSSLARVTQLSRPEDKRIRSDGSIAGPEHEEFWIKDPRFFHVNRDLIVPGDLIYNPAWDPNHKVRVALAGTFDLDADGVDDLDTFRGILRDLGVEVSAYIDNKLEIRGKVDYNTTYLLIGDVPQVDVDAAQGQKREETGAMNVQVSKLRDAAAERGIEVIDLRRFLARMGYTTLRVPTRRPGTAYEPPARKEGAEEGAAPKPAEDGPPKEKEEK